LFRILLLASGKAFIIPYCRGIGRRTLNPTTPLELPRPLRLKDGSEVTLRHLHERDAEEVCRTLPLSHRESDFLMFLPGEFNLTVEQEREYIRERDKNPRTLLICAEVEGRIAALCGARQNGFRRYAHQAEVGITVYKVYWGLGLGRALTQFVIDWAPTVGLRKLGLRVFEDNHKAIALYRSLGFVEEGRIKDDVLRVDGRYSDTIVMGLFV